jgi:hypothetical protein
MIGYIGHAKELADNNTDFRLVLSSGAHLHRTRAAEVLYDPWASAPPRRAGAVEQSRR